MRRRRHEGRVALERRRRTAALRSDGANASRPSSRKSLAVLRIRWALGCGAIGAVQYWREQLYVGRPRRLWRAVA